MFGYTITELVFLFLFVFAFSLAQVAVFCRVIPEKGKFGFFSAIILVLMIFSSIITLCFTMGKTSLLWAVAGIGVDLIQVLVITHVAKRFMLKDRKQNPCK